MVCRAWALQGYGTPIAIYLAYVAKIALYVGGWLGFCHFTPGMGGLQDFADWWMRPEAYQKAILWSMLFEVLGLGCGSGPLTGRYLPPFGGFLYFLRPGTTKLPVVRGLPVVGGHRRTLLDVGLYALLVGLLLAGLVAAAPAWGTLAGIAVVTVLLGLLDKTLFLAARGEHYWTTIVVFVLATNWIPGAKGIHAALWFWAGISKLNHHFPSVVGVMTSNSPFTRIEFVRRMMYRSYPEDLRPSSLATIAGHAGTVLELAVPIVLLSGDGGTVTLVGLGLMLLLHGFITSNVPMGVPLEWNVIMVYGGFFLFWKNAAVGLGAMTLPVLLVVGTMGFVVPLLGNLFPARISFLLAMRYYAGNWPYSVWFFRGKSYEKLAKLTMSSRWIYDQLGALYDRPACIGIIGKVMGFRLMHLHGRLLGALVPRILPRFEDYEWIDGEVVAGLVLGWNFGDGHLHREDLLEAIQKQCGFEEGELRCVMVEAQPLFQRTLHYRAHDAKTGLLEEGHVDVGALRERQPWSTAAVA
jgi:hypothetical protein